MAQAAVGGCRRLQGLLGSCLFGSRHMILSFALELEIKETTGGV